VSLTGPDREHFVHRRAERKLVQKTSMCRTKS
jgi:hypothetical protein